jgi:hypothetical protein
MKHTANSQLYNIFNFHAVLNKNLLFIFLCGIVLMTGQLAHAQLPQTYDFESSAQGWFTSASDNAGIYNSSSWSCSGSRSIYTRATSENSVISPVLDFRPYAEVTISFCHKSFSLENNEGFSLQFLDGTDWQTIKTFLRGTDFTETGSGTTNNFSETISSSDYTFTTNSRFRFLNNVNQSNEWNFFDDIEITSPAPTNDECSNATVLIPNDECIETIGTTSETSQSLPPCSGTADDDVWYVFQATHTEHTVTVATGTIIDIVFQVFEGNCGGPSITCEDSNWGYDTESATLNSLTIGNTYYIRVYSWSAREARRGSFSICILNPCTPGDGNGTSANGCPGVDVTIGSGDEATTIDCDNYGSAIELDADFLTLGDTRTYRTEEIPFSPPYQFGCLTNTVFIDDDDVWSPVIDFSSNNFDFCFYGRSYNSCTVNANGVISFDTNLAETYTGWEINNSLPSDANSRDNNGNDFDYGASIFGVHHDIDPRRGGEIGWEFVDVTSGAGSCRALVTSWHDVPMYADNSILYSGMIVLYENSNVIEVYVEEKNTDGYSGSYGDTWNFGNAQIGIQDETSTEATVIRDISDDDWTVNSRAWRFVPDGASISDLRWLVDGVHNATYDGNTSISVSPTETTIFTAEVTYNLCNSAIIRESDDFIVTVQSPKVWDGSESRDWDHADNWSPSGVPTLADCVLIPPTANNPRINGTSDGTGYNLEIQDGATLVERPRATLTIENQVVVAPNAIFRVRNNASLIQINDVANIVDGEFTMERRTTMRLNDYVYWSSPVTNFNIEDVSPGTPNGFKYQWLPFANRTPGPPGPLNFGEWEAYNTGAMDVGKGYIIKGPNGHTTTPSIFSATFRGNPNNGELIQPITRSSYILDDYPYQPYGGDVLLITSDDDNWNLIGNPYPSALNAMDFLALPANANIYGMVYLWTHGTDINAENLDSFYEDYIYNYNVADYIAYNSSGTSTPSAFDGNIGAGQGFFVLMNDLASETESVTFNNSMRNSAYANDQFYRHAEPNASNANSSRIWLDYISPDGGTNTTLIAYTAGATNGADRLFDAINSKGTGLNLYSLIEDKNYLIQGRQLPFDDNDRVPLGINITTSGIQTIAINTIEGRFEDSNHPIFLEDLETGSIHNLKNAPYTFSSDDGRIDNRFVLRYTNATLGIEDFDTASGIKVFEDNEHMSVKSQHAPIAAVEVFDILGRALYANRSVNLNRLTITALKPEDRILFIKIILTDGKQKIAKLIF